MDLAWCQAMIRLFIITLIVISLLALEVLSADSDVNGAHPLGGVALAGRVLYGTTANGGVHGGGTLWSYDLRANRFSGLYDFTTEGDGEMPFNDGQPQGDISFIGSVIYGTGLGGFQDFPYGTIWSFDTNSGEFAKLHQFVGEDGINPRGVDTTTTTVFGTATDGGSLGYGTLWSFDPVRSELTKLHDFTGPDDGSRPFATPLVVGSSVIGTASGTPTFDDHTLWSYDTVAETFTKLHSFDVNVDGSSPASVAVKGTTIIGTSSHGVTGGVDYSGAIWAFDTSTNRLTNVYLFDQTADGRRPVNGTILSGEILFGTAEFGGANGYGTLWSFDTGTNDFTKLFDFGDGSGREPKGSISALDDKLFGVTRFGGVNDEGTIWSFDTRTSEFTVLYEFGAVPEPSALSLFSIGALLILLRRR